MYVMSYDTGTMNIIISHSMISVIHVHVHAFHVHIIRAKSCTPQHGTSGRNAMESESCKLCFVQIHDRIKDRKGQVAPKFPRAIVTGF